MNILDTRDLYKRQCELQSELDDLLAAIEEANEPADKREYGSEEADELARAEQDLLEWQDEYRQELDALNDLEIEIGSEWMHGEQLIDVDDFEEYAQDLAYDIGAVDRNMPWPLTWIDWEQAAKELTCDYSMCTYDGTDYYFRAS